MLRIKGSEWFKTKDVQEQDFFVKPSSIKKHHLLLKIDHLKAFRKKYFTSVGKHRHYIYIIMLGTEY